MEESFIQLLHFEVGEKSITSYERYMSITCILKLFAKRKHKNIISV